MSLVGEGKTATHARRLASAKAPDIVILDIAIPGGREVVAEMAKRDIKCVVLTTLDDALSLSGAVAHGANGYILKA
jgi:DNA-binding NarL/FixJ family response regulator